MVTPSRALSGKYAIAGVGESRLGRVPELSSIGLLVEAARNALDDAGLSIRDVDGLICRGPDDMYCFHQQLAQRLGLNCEFGNSLDSGGASQILSVALACMAIEAGLATTVLCGYARNSWSRTRGNGNAGRTNNDLVPAEQRPREFGPEYGMFGAVGMHGFGAQRHMHLYGTKREAFGAIATTFREHALRNPNAVMKKPLTLEEYLEARMIVEPFGLYDCSLVTDGAGAMIVTTAERARDMRQPLVKILGFGTFNNTKGWFEDDHMVSTAAAESGAKAYAMAGVGPEDIDTAQIYDCFTYMVMTQLEDYGFCKKGEGGDFVSSGAIRMGGRLPTNTSGGQLSEAHVEGCLQVVEGARQLRHTYSPDRQVSGAEIALVSGHGGNTVCHSSLILGKA